MDSKETNNQDELQNSVNEEVNAATSEETQTSEESAQTELEQLKEKCEKMRNEYLLLFADFDNYKKRTLKEKAELIKSAGENIFNNILPLVDDFERAKQAMATATDVDAMREGVDLIYGKFVSFLSQNGVKAIDTEAKEFDTDFHEAIAKIPAPSEDLKGKIIDCTQKGYTLNDKVIRFAKVVVGE